MNIGNISQCENALNRNQQMYIRRGIFFHRFYQRTSILYTFLLGSSSSFLLLLFIHEKKGKVISESVNVLRKDEQKEKDDFYLLIE